MIIEDIASVHLGKAGDGTVVKPYVTPDKVDPSLLVVIPRDLNRKAYGITDADFIGMDVWNCYEVSFIDFETCVPQTYIAKIVYPSNSYNIVESKSLKLYLNSFNMCKSDKGEARSAIESSLSYVLGCAVDVMLFDHINLHLEGTLPNISYSEYSGSKATYGGLLKATNIFTTPRTEWFQFDHLRSNCRVTNQPDWGDVYIMMNGENEAAADNLHQYISTIREENHFHEEICEKIYIDLRNFFEPLHLAVGCFYTRRGGIDINPIRASSQFALEVFDEGKYRFYDRRSEKTMKQ